ncbi:MAG: hypothetical protein IJ341_02445 [Bacteroidales bacterium]|nr:hypothetical protein [Bacteroidales bacterium]
MVLSDKLFTSKEYLKLILNRDIELTSDNEVEEIELLTEEAGECLWSHSLSEIVHIVEEELNVVLVDCLVLNNETGQKEHIYRWFECNFDSDDIKGENIVL